MRDECQKSENVGLLFMFFAFSIGYEVNFYVFRWYKSLIKCENIRS